MAETKGYVILTEDIKDPDGMVEYMKLAAPTFGQVEGIKVLAVDQTPEQIEGEWHGTQTVVLEFPSVEAAKAWYFSEDYQKAKALRQAAADCNAAILTGLPS